MELQLKGKSALVSGSTAGIGVGIARCLAAEGVHVVIHGRNAERAQRVAHEIRDTGGKASVALGDLETDDGAQYVIKTALEKGPIDILVNMARGDAVPRPAGE